MKSESITKAEAQKRILHSQQVLTKKSKETPLNASLSVIEQLGYIQIDTISVVQRAHHHTLWSRNHQYNNAHIDMLVKEKSVFEYWSHAAAYLPMCHYRHSLPRKNAIASGQLKHWYSIDKKLLTLVLDRIKAEGPLMAKDFDGKNAGFWGSKPAKRALEHLFMQGDLMISERRNFHKVYDLTQRVLPAHINTTLPSEKEHVRFLISSFIKANALAQTSEICYLLRNIKPLVTAELKAMHANGELINIQVNDKSYYALPDALQLLNKPIARRKAKILSPFDNLLIQRKRMLHFFDFDYQIECYLPEAKRQFGYFSLPILWNGKMVARMDCKAERKTKVLHVKHLHVEAGLKNTENFAADLNAELNAFMVFNNCESIQFHQITPTNITSLF